MKKQISDIVLDKSTVFTSIILFLKFQNQVALKLLAIVAKTNSALINVSHITFQLYITSLSKEYVLSL